MMVQNYYILNIIHHTDELQLHQVAFAGADLQYEAEGF